MQSKQVIDTSSTKMTSIPLQVHPNDPKSKLLEKIHAMVGTT